MGFATKVGIFPKNVHDSEFAFVRVAVVGAFAKDKVVGKLNVQV